jgi:multicomponent Na+:H+ antiporter subunit E
LEREALNVRAAVRAVGWRGFALRLVLLSAGWWVLTQAERSGIAFGIASVALALAASLWLSRERTPAWRLSGVLRFAAFFLAGSLRGGVDVALRALLPGPALRPTVIRLRSRLPSGPALNLFMSALSMLPGTLSVDSDRQAVFVHVLVDSQRAASRMMALEERVAAAIGLTLVDGDDRDG